jgi:predicted transcriptional regulator
MKLLELFEQAGKTAAVAFGRMNPPTIGHQKVVAAILKQKADAHFLFVSQTHKSTGKNKTRLENPLPFDIKLGFIEQAFPNIDIGDTSVGTAIGVLQSLEKQGFENVIFICGSDRVPAFTELFNKQNGIDYNLKSIKIESSGARDPDAEGAEGMSASKMRAAAIVNDFDAFKTGLPAGLQRNADEVFSAVRQGLEPWLEQGMAEGSETAADIDKKIAFHQQGQAAAQYKGSMNKMHAKKIKDLEAKKAALKQGVAEASLGNVLPWPEVVNKVNSAMKATGWKGKRMNDDAFMFTTRGAEVEDQWYIAIIDNAGDGFFTYALGTVEEGDPHIDDAFKGRLPNTEASVSELMDEIRDGFGLD